MGPPFTTSSLDSLTLFAAHALIIITDSLILFCPSVLSLTPYGSPLPLLLCPTLIILFIIQNIVIAIFNILFLPSLSQKLCNLLKFYFITFWLVLNVYKCVLAPLFYLICLVFTDVVIL